MRARCPRCHGPDVAEYPLDPDVLGCDGCGFFFDRHTGRAAIGKAST